MWNWLNCYLSGRHDYGVTCDAGAIFLRCIHCGKRSNGWVVHDHGHVAPLVAPSARVINGQPANVSRTLEFTPRVAGQQQSA